MSINYDTKFYYLQGHTHTQTWLFGKFFLLFYTKKIIILRVTNNKSCFIFVVRVLFPFNFSDNKHFIIFETNFSFFPHIFFLYKHPHTTCDQVVLLLLHQLQLTLVMVMVAWVVNNNHILRWQHRFQARPMIMVFMLMKLTVQLPMMLLQTRHQFFCGNVNYVLLGKERDISVSRIKQTKKRDSNRKYLTDIKKTFFSLCLSYISPQ